MYIIQAYRTSYSELSLPIFGTTLLIVCHLQFVGFDVTDYQWQECDNVIYVR